MTKIILTLALLLGCASAFAGGGTTNITTTSVVQLGEAERKGKLPAWVASTVYSQGSVVRGEGSYYVAVVAGTSGATIPSGKADFTDNTVTWRHMLPGRREGLFISNAGTTANVTVVFERPAVSGSGIVLVPGASIVWSGEDTPQTKISLIAASGTQSTIIWEW